MSVEVKWYDVTCTILYIKVITAWTWEKYAQVGIEIEKMGASIEHQFHMISDMTASSAVPEGDILAHIAHGVNRNPPNLRLALWVSTPQLLQTAIVTLNAAVGSYYPKCIFVDTVEEALKIIDRYQTNNDNPVD